MTAEVMRLDMKVQNQDKSGYKYVGVKGTVPILKKSALAGTFFNIRDMYLKTDTNFSVKLYFEKCYIDYRVSQ